ncbi:monocarboxylate transporter 12-like isoform X1 [Ostrea edulis]|uniref:monocarboxylate transporter 12-like isoform X1 n=2 Tax=Ostrea edulis TaxID=37623 RepID=UPI0024AEC039|nr:monocarboxylate transporter 12-like isoform X1 [Ostrea edulis]
MTQHECRGEGGYGWIVVLALFVNFLIIAGLQSSSGIIHTELMRTTSADLSVIGWIGSLLTGLCAISSPIVSVLTRMIPCRVLAIIGNIMISLGFFCAFFTSSVPVLILCLGVIPGIGSNLIVFSITMIVKGYFVKRLPLVYGIALSGIGVGMLSFPSFYVYLHTSFGTNGSFLLCSAVCLNGMVLSCLSKPNASKLREKTPDQSVSKTKFFDFSLFKSYHFVLFVTAHLAFNIGNATPFTYLQIKGLELGFSEQSSALFITTLGAGSSVARIAFGWFSAKFPKIRIRSYLIVVLMASLSTLPVAFTSSYPLILVCSALFGSCAGVTHTEIPTIIIGMMGIDRLDSALSVAYLQQGIGSLIGIPLTDIVCRSAGNNNVSFIFTFGITALAFLLMVLSFYLPNKAPRNVQSHEISTKFPEPKPEVFVVDASETRGPAAA